MPRPANRVSLVHKANPWREEMTKTISLIVAGVAATALLVAPALADKVEKMVEKDLTIGGKTYQVSGSRTKVTIGGKAGTRDGIKVGMDCKVTGAPGAEASAVDCK